MHTNVILERNVIKSDLLIIGGGAAGCYAAIAAARKNPDLRIVLVDKANIKRSGCLAAGVNAINAYIAPDSSPQEYLDYVRRDAEKIIREDLVLSMAKRFNEVVAELEKMGLVILKNERGEYVRRGKRNLKINGENIKTILADEVARYDNVFVVNKVNVTDLIQEDNGRVVGAVGFSVDYETAFIFSARATLVASGGAAGLYRPKNPGFSRHKTWYCPFNVGSGYAMGIRAGAEMTTFEMRFVAQRIKDTIAPTGTIALGVGAKEINARGEFYAKKYGTTTSGRAFGASNEKFEGRGPCYLKTVGITKEQEEDLYRAYLNMAPAQTLKWIESGESPSTRNVEIEGAEPYVVGGHTASGYWVDVDRRTTLRGLYAAGDVAGGAPKKFVTGSMVEGLIATESVARDVRDLPEIDGAELVRRSEPFIAEYENEFNREDRSIYNTRQLEEAMQKIMDDYAGGSSTYYRYNENLLELADKRIDDVALSAKKVKVSDMDELLLLHELLDRLVVCKTLVAHMRARKETRWPGFGVNGDFPTASESEESYVNSVLVDGKVEVRRRDLVKEVSCER